MCVKLRGDPFTLISWILHLWLQEGRAPFWLLVWSDFQFYAQHLCFAGCFPLVNTESSRSTQLTSTELAAPRSIPPFYQTSCFRMVKSMVRPEKSRTVSPLLHFCCEVCSWDFPGSPVVKTPCFHCRGCRFNPWSGN